MKKTKKYIWLFAFSFFLFVCLIGIFIIFGLVIKSIDLLFI